MRLHREGQQHFPRVLLALLGPQPHGHRREKNAQNDRHGAEKRAHVCIEKGEEWRHEQPDTQHLKHNHKDITDRGAVIRTKLPTKDRPEISHIHSLLRILLFG